VYFGFPSRCAVVPLGDLLQVARNLTNKMGSVVVPQEKIGKLIGPRGAVINKIRADTGMSGMLNIVRLSCLMVSCATTRHQTKCDGISCMVDCIRHVSLFGQSDVGTGVW